MPNEPKHFTIIDPRDFDGDPYDVAGRACAQAEAIVGLLIESLEATNIVIRNAAMETDLGLAETWEASPGGKSVARITEDAGDLQRKLKALGQFASYNPKRPPKA